MLLNMIRDLGEKELDLDKKLNDSNKAIFVDEDDEKKKIGSERLKRRLRKIELQDLRIVVFTSVRILDFSKTLTRG